MDSKKVLSTILDHLPEFLEGKSSLAQTLWTQLLGIHPADIASFLTTEYRLLADFFPKLPRKLKISVFEHFTDKQKIESLSLLDDKEKTMLLESLGIDEVTDLFESLSNEELKHYLALLGYHERQKVLSLLEFHPQSAAGIMDTDVLSLREDFTVEKASHVMQRLAPRKELHQQIYVTNKQNQLVGFINLEDLVLKGPKIRLSRLMHAPELVAQAHEDQEIIAKKMLHYNQMNVPVVNEQNRFLGVIPSETLVEIIEQEASEDVLRISAMSAMPQSYFETSFGRLLWERSYILIILLLAQSLSTMIVRQYEVMLAGFLMGFITMLVSTGGNSSSQTSALVIQGMASGEINKRNVHRFLRREFFMAALMALILGIVAFLRVYFTSGNMIGSIAVSLSLGAIVMVSVVLGSGIPILLKRIGMDPAFAAGPFLATIMDILGLLLFCYISSLILI